MSEVDPKKTETETLAYKVNEWIMNEWMNTLFIHDS